MMSYFTWLTVNRHEYLHDKYIILNNNINNMYDEFVKFNAKPMWR